MDAIGLNLNYMVTNSIYAMDGYHAIFGVSIKKACSEKMQRKFSRTGKKIMETVKKFSQQKKKYKDSFNFEHVWSLAIKARTGFEPVPPRY